jgi:hypothetical protein
MISAKRQLPAAGLLLVLLGITAWGQQAGTGSSPGAEGRPAPRQDALGDPLPVGALTRMGTVRLRHDHTVLSVAFVAGGKTLASAGNDYTARLWELATGKELRRFGQQTARGSATSPARAVHSLAVSPNGKLLAVGIEDSNVYLWETGTGKSCSGSPDTRARSVLWPLRRMAKSLPRAARIRRFGCGIRPPAR